jgi:hypothetical protein
VASALTYLRDHGSETQPQDTRRQDAERQFPLDREVSMGEPFFLRLPSCTALATTRQRTDLLNPWIQAVTSIGGELGVTGLGGRVQYGIVVPI